MSVLVVLALCSARAQEAPPVNPSPVPLSTTVAPAAPERPSEPLVDRGAWKGPELPDDAGPLVGISVGADGVWVAADVYGGIYTTDDVGLRWRVGLGARNSPHVDAIDEEQMLLEAESQIEDEADTELQLDADVGDPESADDLEDLPEAADGPDGNTIELAIEAAQAEARRDDASTESAWAWMHPTEVGLGFASRSDGFWRTEDSGRTWSRIGDESGLTGALLLGEALLFAGPTGVVYTADRGETRLSIDIGGGARVNQLAVEEGVVYAATDNGLYRTTDGMSWWGSALLIPVTGVAGDPAWTGGLWVTTHDGVLRSDDAGVTFRPASRQPVLGMRGLVSLPEAGHVLAWGGDGVWESVDNGVSWAPIVRGLRDPEVRSLALIDGWPLIATPSGVWALRPWSAPKLNAQDGWVDVGALITAAVEREGLAGNMLGVARGGVAARFMPKLIVTGEARSKAQRASDFLLFETTEYGQTEWKVKVEACFGGCVSDFGLDVDEAYEAYEDGYDSVAESVEDAEADTVPDGMMVTDMVVDTEAEPVLAAMNIAQSIQNYKVRIAGTVAEAEISRRTLLAASPAIASQSIAAQVEHQLKIQEAEARLDLYTDGAFTQLRVIRAPESP